jgi:hypothetical protein
MYCTLAKITRGFLMHGADGFMAKRCKYRPNNLQDYAQDTFLPNETYNESSEKSQIDDDSR